MSNIRIPNEALAPKAESMTVTPMIKWEDAEASAFRTFLDRSKSFLPYLASQVPRIKTTSLEEAALTGARHAGYEELFRVLASMTGEQEQTVKSPYITEDRE